MSKTPIQPQDKYVLRMPDGMRERIKREADENNRSMNAEIIARLDESLSGKLQRVDRINERLGSRLERIERDLQRMMAVVSREIEEQKSIRAEPDRLNPTSRAFRQGIVAFRENDGKTYINPFDASDRRHTYFIDGFLTAARRFYKDTNSPELIELANKLFDSRRNTFIRPGNE